MFMFGLGELAFFIFACSISLCLIGWSIAGIFYLITGGFDRY